MASEDVIELGSSDDEAEPVVKKIKPMPNAMVHIPRKLHDVTIKPARRNISPNIAKELAGNNVTMTKINKVGVLANPYTTKKPNGKQIQYKQVPNFIQVPKKGTVIQNKSTVNPLSIMKKINSQLVINKVPSATKVLRNPIRIQSPQSINNLPPSITVTRTPGGLKRIATANVQSNLQKKLKRSHIPKTTDGEVLTVDLDDEEVSSSSASPQWYLRPEEQSMEEENNKEPESTKSDTLIEITVEDSPVKPVVSAKDRRMCEVEAGFTVTIDDSPVKPVIEKKTASGSEEESRIENIEPQSKKKLVFPKEREEVEIEISPIAIEQKDEQVNSNDGDKNDNIIEIEESPLKMDSGQVTSTPKKDKTKSRLDIPDSIKELQDEDDLSEFHPVYRSFIRLCFQLENSDDMKKIVEKKIKTYYRQVPKEYTESDEFTDMVAGKVLSIKAGPEKMYLYIKDVVDELNLQRKIAKSQVLDSEKKASDSSKHLYGPDSEFDSKRQRQIRKLEKTLKKLHRAIQKLEEQEVDFDDDEDSVYLLTESDEGSTPNTDSGKQLEKDPKALLKRYKERMVRVHAKFCQLTNTKMPSEPRLQLEGRPGQPSGPAKRLERWINKKVPIGTPLPFPDFQDVLRCVRQANDEDKLGWNEADIMEEARDLFTRCGKKLQRRRQENEWRIAASRISVDVDPAENSNELKKKLDDNKKIASKKEADVFNKYADRQTQLKLEAEEIGDKEAEESPADDDEDEDLDPTDENSLENKEKRKERLKKLIQDKSKKADTNTLNVSEKESSQEKNTQKIDDEIVKSGHKQVKDKTDVSKNETKETPPSVNKDANEIDSTTTNEIDKFEKDTVVGDKNSLDGKLAPKSNEKIEIDTESPDKENNQQCTDKILSISDDSSKIESDIDELHLLQKLHSENDINTSTIETLDSETPLASSDALVSSGEMEKDVDNDDVISIENSTYSESENHQNLSDCKETNDKPDKIVDQVVDVNTELECSNLGVERKQVQTNNDEYNESIEDILLASSDDELEAEKNVKPANDKECINLKDDTISIGDTVVEGVESKGDSADGRSPVQQNDTDSIESVVMKVDSTSESNIDENSQEDTSKSNDENTNVKES